jgi:hypothetical protein
VSERVVTKDEEKLEERVFAPWILRRRKDFSSHLIYHKLN